MPDIYKDYNPKGEMRDEVDEAFIEKELRRVVSFIQQIILKEEVAPLELHDALERAELLLRDVVGSEEAENVYDELEELIDVPMLDETAPYEYTKSVLAKAVDVFQKLDAKQRMDTYVAWLRRQDEIKKRGETGWAA
jgi:hypothetical protein